MAPLPDLVSNKPAHFDLLPPGVHEATIDEIYQAFVEGKSDKRKLLWDRWLAYRTVVFSLIEVNREFLDGSFVTSKHNPKDIDVSMWISGDELLDAPNETRTAISLLTGAGSFEVFSVDAYFITECEPSSPLYADFVENRDWCEEAWSRSRDRRQKLTPPAVQKGYVEVLR